MGAITMRLGRCSDLHVKGWKRDALWFMFCLWFEYQDNCMQTLLRLRLVRLAGIEPTTLGFGGQYSIH